MRVFCRRRATKINCHFDRTDGISGYTEIVPVLIRTPLSVPEPVEPPRKKWTRREMQILEKTGLFEGERYELIDGELINKMGMNRLHALGIMAVVAALIRVFGVSRVQIQMPLDVAADDNPASEPQPDAYVTQRPAAEIKDGNPGSKDVALVVEVAGSSFQFDANVKARLYARAGIQDYWLVDLNQRRVLVHREPGEGIYRSVVAYYSGESFFPLGADVPVSVGELLP